MGLQRGARGADVRALQQNLVALGLLASASEVDGIYGPKTEGAVHAFQLRQGLTPTGEATDETLAAIARAASPASMKDFLSDVLDPFAPKPAAAPPDAPAPPPPLAAPSATPTAPPRPFGAAGPPAAPPAAPPSPWRYALWGGVVILGSALGLAVASLLKGGGRRG